MNVVRQIQPKQLTATALQVSGKLPPHDLEAEAAVLSTVLLKSDYLRDLRGLIEPEHFYGEANGRIYRAALELADVGSPVDLITISRRLQDQGLLSSVGGTAYMAEIVDKTPAIQNVLAHAEIVIRKATMRALATQAHILLAELYADDRDSDEDDKLITGADQRFREVVEKRTGGQAASEHLIEPTRRVFNKYLATNSRPQDELVTTGFPDLDTMLALEPGTLVVIGARSGRGKSSLSTQMAMHVGRRWGNALYFSSEMPSEQLALRAACMLAKVDSKRVRRGLCSNDEGHRLLDATNEIRDTCQFMVDKSGLDILAISATARREVKRLERANGKRVRAIFIDYLQRVRAGRAAPFQANREQQVSAIAMHAKELAMELKTCVVMPAQLNADADKRDDERPRVSDMRESKGIENEADEVVLIHNPHYLARTQNEHADLSEPEACEIIKGKGRNDGNGLVRLWFTPIWSRFDSMTQSDKDEERERLQRAKQDGRRGRR